MIDQTSSSLLISICRASKNFRRVEHVITCVLEVSIPAQLANILDAAMALKTFFCAFCASVNSMSSELFRVKRPGKTKKKILFQFRAIHRWVWWIRTYFSLTWNRGTQFGSTSTFFRIQSRFAFSRYGKLIEQIPQILACQQTET